jgi:hypothetical protein
MDSREEAEATYGFEDDPDQYVVLALDPGGVTGWAVMGFHPEVMSGDPGYRALDNIEFWTAGEFSGAENSQCDETLELVASWPSARLVIEDFILRKQSMGRELLAPVRITAVLEYEIRPRYWVKQQPSLAMSTVTDERQKDAGLWIPGKPHARDALKHCLTFVKRQRERQIRAAGAAPGAGSEG